MMPLSSSEYRKHAEACLALAKRAMPQDQNSLVEMAEVWLKLATEQLEAESATGQNAPSTDTSQ
jgi:hypothetical protein